MSAKFSVAQVGGQKNALETFAMRVTTLAQKAQLDIGIHKEDAQRSSTMESSTGLQRVTNSQLAVWHEFGTATLPARPFLRPVFRLNNAAYQVLSAQLFKRYIEGKLASPEAVLTLLGQRIVSDVQRYFMKSVAPAASLATVQSKRARGMPRPHVVLYATGGLFNSIKAKLKSHAVVRTVPT